jgi:hypothetical protein
MSENDGFTLDFTEFNKTFFQYAEHDAPDAVKAGLFEALGELKHDADEVAPKTPYLDGHLRAEHTKVMEQLADVIRGTLTFLMPYAARMHEGLPTWNWTQTRAGGGVGPKYLENKMVRKDLRDKYMGIVAARIRKTTEK